MVLSNSEKASGNAKQETSLQSIIHQISSQVDAYDTTLSRIAKISDRLETNPPVDEATKEAESSIPYSEGVLYALAQLAKRMDRLNRNTDYYLNRIEKHV